VIKVYYKYPRTPHLPWSLGATNDDKILKNVYHFYGQEVVVMEKVDGECSSLYSAYIHARSMDSKDHISRHWLKQFHSQIKREIPDGWRICGENMYACHSIYYNSLPSYFLGFSIYNENNVCRSWKETKYIFDVLRINYPNILYQGIYNEEKIKECCDKYYSHYWKENNEDYKFAKENKKDVCQEGYVIRLADIFHYKDFDKSMAKFVRKNHIQTDEHWMSQKLITNKLKVGD
jgi:hypothetical protein